MASSEDLLHQLQVHQIELTMQNEALCEAQAALEVSRNRYLDLYEFAPVGYLTLNEHGLIDDINLTGSRLLNQERHKLLHMPFVQYVAPADQHSWYSFFRLAMQNGDSLTVEVELNRNDGIHLFVSLKCVTIRVGDVVKGLRLTLSNVTDLKKALSDLKIREDRLQLAKAASDLGLFDHDLVGGEHLVDERLREIWGFGLSEPVGLQQIMDSVHPEDRNAVQVAVDHAFSPLGSGRYVAQYRVIHRIYGTIRHVLANGQVFFHFRRPVRFVGTVKDISAQIQLEAEAQEQNHALELLAHQQIALQTAAAIAHDINQPLVSISAYSEAALRMLGDDARDPQKLKRALEGAVEQAQRAGRSLHELLEFLHQGEVVTEVLDLNQVVQDAIGLAEVGIYRSFSYVFEPEPDLPPVRINRLQVQKVIGNLLQNACEAMSTVVPLESTIAITIAISVRRMDGIPMAKVSVRDSGPGFGADTARRAFEPFFSTKTHGIGLGLAISRALIEANGGQLWIEPDPEPARGATLHFSVPFA